MIPKAHKKKSAIAAMQWCISYTGELWQEAYFLDEFTGAYTVRYFVRYNGTAQMPGAITHTIILMHS